MLIESSFNLIEFSMKYLFELCHVLTWIMKTKLMSLIDRDIHILTKYKEKTNGLMFAFALFVFWSIEHASLPDLA